MPDSHAERLALLFNDLTASGFQITPEQRIKTTGLFLTLLLSGDPPHLLGSKLGPVLCGSATQQDDFHHIFQTWFPSPDSTKASEDPSLVDTAEPSWQQKEGVSWRTKLHRQRDLLSRWFKRQGRALAPGLAVVFFVSLLVQVFLYLYFRESPAPIQEQGQPIGSTGLPAPDPDEALNPDDKLSPNIKQFKISDSTDIPESDSWSTPVIDGLARVAAMLKPRLMKPGLVATLLFMIPLGLLALLIRSSRQWLSAYARQTRVQGRSEFRRLLVETDTGRSLVGDRFFHDVQPMRRQIDLPSGDIDVDRTIEASVQAGGYLTPVYTKQGVSPEYVVLIDRRHEGDQQAQYFHALIEMLERAGVHLVVYFFNRDPRRLTLWSGERTLYLEDFSIIESSRLIVFTDGQGLFDIATGHLQPWAVRFADWPRAVLLTPKDTADWGRSEWLIEKELGLGVLPASEGGLLLSAHFFDLQEPAVNLALHNPHLLLPDSDRLSGYFAVAAWRWVDDIEPEPEEVEDLIRQLRSELSEEAFDALCALAIYPALYWNLSLLISAKLGGKVGPALLTERGLLEIVRLPWFEHGHMPDWFRKRLIEEMPSGLRVRVRDILEDLLLTVVSRNAKSFALEIDLAVPDETPQITQEPDWEVLEQDKVLIDFMTRREALSVDFRISNRVAASLKLLPGLGSKLNETDKAPTAKLWVRPVAWVAFAAVVLVAGGLGWQALHSPEDSPEAIVQADPIVAPEVGGLQITTVPSGSRVTIRGAAVDSIFTAPLILSDLPIGVYYLTANHEEYQPNNQWVSIIGQDTVEVEIDLIQGAVSVFPVPIAEQAQGDTLDVGMALSSAMLELNSNPPGAVVYLNDQEWKHTPFTDTVAAGSHQLRLELEGYDSFSLELDFQPGKTYLLPTIKLVARTKSDSAEKIKSALDQADKQRWKRSIDEMRAEPRVALVIGNGKYKEVPLRNPVNDARAIGKELEKLRFEVSYVLDSDQAGMHRAISNFGQVMRAGGVGLFFYAGHGMSIKGRNYLIPVGTEIHAEDEVEFQTIDAYQVLAEMEDAGNRINIVILDASRDNPFARSSRSLKYIGRGLARLDSPPGTIIIYSTALGEVASDGEGENSLFTAALIRHISTPGLMIEEMLRKVRLDVWEQTDGDQMPWVSSSLIGEFYFNLE